MVTVESLCWVAISRDGVLHEEALREVLRPGQSDIQSHVALACCSSVQFRRSVEAGMDLDSGCEHETQYYVSRGRTHDRICP